MITNEELLDLGYDYFKHGKSGCSWHKLNSNLAFVGSKKEPIHAQYIIKMMGGGSITHMIPTENRSYDEVVKLIANYENLYSKIDF